MKGLLENKWAIWGSFYVLVLAFWSSHVANAGVWPSTILKVLPSLVLAAFIAGTFRRYQRYLMLVTLLMNVAGDVVLNIDRTRFFMPGLVCFLLAHVLYTILFARNVGFRSTSRMVVLAVVLAFAGILAVVLSRTPAEFRAPVYAYLAIITFMTSAAVVNRSLEIAVGIGGIVYMVSDAMIAINKFVVPLPNYTWVSIPLYFTAQIVIVYFYQRSMFAGEN